MSDLHKFFCNDPVKPLAEEASPAIIYRWIDHLYESVFKLDRTLTTKMYVTAAITEHIETYSLNDECMRKFLSAVELGAIRAQEMLELLEVSNSIGNDSV